MRIFLSFLALFFLSCAYVPTSKMAQKLFGDKVYVNVEIATQDPENSVFVVDTLRALLINRLGKSPALKEEADEFINVKMENLNFIPIIYDENGYVIAYKAELKLEFDVRFKDGQRQRLRTSGSYEFNISPNSVISDNAKLDAMRFASNEAFNEFVAIMAIKGHQNGQY